MSRCVYCLNDKNLLLACADCRSRFEIAKRELEFHQRIAKFQRAESYRLKKENERLRAELSKARKK